MPKRSWRPTFLLGVAAIALVASLWSLASWMRSGGPRRALTGESGQDASVDPTAARWAPLQFRWPAEGSVLVRAEHRRDGVASEEEFELCWRTLEGVGLVVESFPWPWDSESNCPGPTCTSGTVITPVQAVVALDGRFICTPHLEDLQQAWSLCGCRG